MTTTRTPVRAVGHTVAIAPARRQWPWFLALFLVLTLLGGGVYVLYRTPALGLQQLEVSPSSGDLSGDIGDAVRAAADVPIGTPLITVDLDALRRRVLAVPQIASADVSRHWPHALVIRVRQRIPVAVTMANGASYLLDSSGNPYLRVAASQVPSGLLTLDLATPGPRDPGTLAALAVIGSVKAPVRGAVTSVSARSAYDVELHLRDGRSVIWGSPEEGARKMQVLPAVLTRPGRIYDVSDPDIVTITP